MFYRYTYNTTSRPNNIEHISEMWNLLDSEIDDVFVGNQETNLFAIRRFEYSVYLITSFNFMVPFELVERKLEYFKNIFNPKTVAVTCVLFFTLTLLIWALSSGDEHNSYRTLLGCVLNSVFVLLGQGVPNQPRTPRIRLCFAFLILYNFFFLTVYQTLTTSVLSANEKEQKFQSIDDILKYNLQILGSERSLKYFLNNTESKAKAIQKNVKFCNHIEVCIYTVIRRQSAALALPYFFLRYLAIVLGKYSRDPFVQFIPKSIGTYSNSILMRKGFPLFGEFDRMVGWIQAAGYLTKWERELLYMDNNPNIIRVHSSEAHQFQLQDLELFFIMWAVGLSGSVIIFVGEFIWSKVGNRTRIR